MVDRGLSRLAAWLQPMDRRGEEATPRSHDRSAGEERGREGTVAGDVTVGGETTYAGDPTLGGDPAHADSSTSAGSLAYAEDPAYTQDPVEAEHPVEAEGPAHAEDPAEAGDEAGDRRRRSSRHLAGHFSFAGARISFGGGRLSLERDDAAPNAPDQVLAGLSAQRLNPVGWPLRLVAALIDGSLFIPLYVLAWLSMGDLFASAPAVFALAFALVPLVYWTVAEGLTGRTVGKAIVRIRVVNEDGSPLTWRGALVRNLFRYATHAVPLAEVVTLLAIVTSPREQRIGDLVAHTVVVRHVGALGEHQDPRGDPVKVRRGRAL
jgi:uncharacterized RDD family membrane protein YckC